MIRNYPEQHWKTFHKDISQDRFAEKAFSDGRILSLERKSPGEFLKGGKTAGSHTLVVDLKNGKKKTSTGISAEQFGVSHMQLYSIKSGENSGDIRV